MKQVAYFILLLIVVACSENNKEPNAQKIVDKAIEKAGGENYKHATINFEFRGRKYQSQRDGGEFSLERISRDSSGNKVHDILTNDGFTRSINDTIVKVADSLIKPIGNSVNSVHYFAQLPFGLNAAAVNKKLLGKDSISGKEYYEIKVSFAKKGGGTDHEDEYLYWINTKDYTVDYLAYNFEENNGGIRFRKAFNSRMVKGIRFVDYENYKYEKLSTPLNELDSLYEAGKLKRVSTIKTENVSVKISSN